MTTTWVLIIVMKMSALAHSYGGPVAIDGFKDLDSCEAARKNMEDSIKKYESGQCVAITR